MCYPQKFRMKSNELKEINYQRLQGLVPWLYGVLFHAIKWKENKRHEMK